MAEIGEVYGKNYEQQSYQERIRYAVKLIATNIAHKKFSFRYDSTIMWRGNNMYPDAIKTLLTQVQKISPELRLTHINKTTDMINIFPYLVNGPVEYFVLTDLSGKQVKMYSLYITPTLMEAC